jgi:hypothetical protein
MNFKKIITKYQNYKKSYRVKSKLKSFFYKNHSYSFHSTFVNFGALVCAFASPALFISLFNVTNPFLFGLSAAIPLILPIIFFVKLDNKNHKEKCKDINPFLNSLFTEYSIIFIKKEAITKTNDLFNKHTNSETLEEFEELDKVNDILTENHKNQFIKENKHKIKYNFWNLLSLKHVNVDARMYSENKKNSLLDIITCCFEKMPLIDLKSISKKELNVVLNDFNIEEQIKLSDIVKNRLFEENKKEKELSYNLKEIENLKNSNTIINNKNVLITKI